MPMVSDDEWDEFLAGCQALGYERDEWHFGPMDGIPAQRPPAGRIFVHRGNTCCSVDRAADGSWVEKALIDVRRGAFGLPFAD